MHPHPGQTYQFQFTPLREGRQSGKTRPGLYTYFNSRPCGRGDCPPSGCQFHRVFQFTPLREGRPMQQRIDYADELISIHAPAGGATITLSHVLRKFRISIHAPAGGATRSRRSGQHRSKFQFTPLREGRPLCVPYDAYLLVFQFTPLREGRLRFDGTLNGKLQIFQFTPLREGRPTAPFKAATEINFNSRPCGRGDGSAGRSG